MIWKYVKYIYRYVKNGYYRSRPSGLLSAKGRQIMLPATPLQSYKEFKNETIWLNAIVKAAQEARRDSWRETIYKVQKFRTEQLCKGSTK